MRKIFISDYKHVDMPFKAIKPPRERFVRYYNDLSKMEGITEPDLSSYKKTTQYSFSELGDALLSSCNWHQVLEGADLVIIAYWAHEFDPEGSFGAYLAHKYKIKARLFDVCDQGILSPISAIKIAQAYMQSGMANKAVLICFDQTAIPVNPDFTGCFPFKSSASFLVFDTFESSETIYSIEDVNLLPESNICITDTSIIVRPNTPHFSCGELFRPLFDSQCKNSLVDLVVIDAESESIGQLSLAKEQRN